MTTKNFLPGVSRRAFCKLLGGGVVVLITTKPSALFGQQRRGYPEDLNAYLRIDENGHVTVFSGKIEMGQGVMTSQAQMAAEELGVPLESITMILGDTDQVPWDAGTWGSLTTRIFGPALRAAAAEARRVMINLGSAELGVPKSELTADNGMVFVTADPSKKVTYGALAKGKQIARLVDEKAVLRAVKDFKVMGTSPKRLDGLEKVTGKAKYAGDMRLPGMLYARIVRPPVHGAKLKSADVSKAKAMKDVTVVEKDDLVAVLHPRFDGAEEALAAVKAEWDRPAGPPFDTETVADYWLKNGGDPDVRETKGDLAAAKAGAAQVFESTFRTPYKAHAPVEPHTALAEMKDGKITIWSSTQSPFGTREAVKSALGLDDKHVRVITPYVGGGFGGKAAGPQAVEAARLAQITGKPVMVAWSRSEEFYYDTFDPAGVVRIVSAIDKDGKITLWDYNVYASGTRAAEVLYDVPNASVKAYMSSRGGPRLHPFATGPWRAPGAGTNVFARESQIDIMAAAAKTDPLEFRLKNATDPRAISVLKAAADAIGWKAAPGPSGQGRAIAVGIDSETYCALAAQVSVDKATGAIKVDRVVVAQDMGIVVNPEGAKMQMEGCVAMGLGYALAEELNFKGGDVIDRNFGTYRIPRFSWMPRVETIIVRNDELPPKGGGEPAIVPVGAVIANAVFDAVGARVYRLPMTKERVLAAMKKA